MVNKRLLAVLTLVFATAVAAMSCPICGAPTRSLEPRTFEEPEYDLEGLGPEHFPGLLTCRYCLASGWAGYPGDPANDAVRSLLASLPPLRDDEASILQRAAQLHELVNANDYHRGLAWLRAAWAHRRAGVDKATQRAYERALEYFTTYLNDHVTGNLIPWARYLAGACAERLRRHTTALVHYRSTQYTGGAPALLRVFAAERLWLMGF